MAERIQWDRSFSVGVKLLDRQHKRIVDVLNRILLQEEEGVSSAILSDLLNDLTVYTYEHFNTEERLLESFQYPGLPRQREEHKAFRRTLAELCLDATDHEESVPRELLLYMKEWLEHHILETDMEYRSFLKELGAE